MVNAPLTFLETLSGGKAAGRLKYLQTPSVQTRMPTVAALYEQEKKMDRDNNRGMRDWLMWRPPRAADPVLFQLQGLYRTTAGTAALRCGLLTLR
ncbi:hypothetical protein WDV93_25380 [Pantoea ananatis]